MLKYTSGTGATFSIACLCLLLLTTVARGQQHAAPSPCNEAASAPLTYIALPGHPFSTVSTRDGCWLFVSLNSATPRAATGVAVLSRARGQITLKHVFPVEAEPTGMTITHDDK